MPGRFVILRHAESVWNAAGLWQGQADPALSEEGRRQAVAAGDRVAAMGVEAVFSSDLARAVETAEILMRYAGVKAPVAIDTGLREYDVGEWSGRGRKDIESLWPGDIGRFASRELLAPPGGEDRDVFDARVLAASERVGRRADELEVQSILVVCHGGVVRALARLNSVADHRVGHLAGYRGTFTTGGLVPEIPLDLLELELASGSN